MKTILIDADTPVYACGFAAEHKEYKVSYEGEPMCVCENKTDLNKYLKEFDEHFGDTPDVEVVEHVEPVENSLFSMKRVIEGILKTCTEQYGEVKYELYLTNGSTCFRNTLGTIKKYKGNRDDSVKPVYYDAIREYLVKHWGAVELDEIEADDQLIIRGTQLGADNCVLASTDKDLLQFPGNHYNYIKDVFRTVSVVEGYRNLFTQCLVGDTADNIPGIPRVGPKKAEKLLGDVEDPLDMWEIVEAQYSSYYTKNGGDNATHEDAMLALEENAELLYLLRERDDYWDANRYLGRYTA